MSSPGSKRSRHCVSRLCRLEGGCNYDYIEVFDGPHLSSPLIARVCDEARGSFTSSSNFMAIRFVSDGSVSRRGFQADYYSSPSNDSTSKSPSRASLRSRGDLRAFCCSTALWLWNKRLAALPGRQGLSGAQGGQGQRVMGGQGPELAIRQCIGFTAVGRDL